MKLRKSFKFDGKELTEIEYDLEDVTPRDMKRILNTFSKKKIAIAVPELDMRYQQEYFACASGIPSTELDNLSSRDFNAVCGLVRDFLLESSDDQATTEGCVRLITMICVQITMDTSTSYPAALDMPLPEGNGTMVRHLRGHRCTP